MSGDDYGQAFHDGETTGRAEERRAIVARLREIAEHTDPTQPWQSKSEKVRFLLGVATYIEEEGRAPSPLPGEEGRGTR